jgi:twinkle protein|tara:strand:- start:829 stop:2514 length:1686 start_codon:yes stop_codon:yes gene_type:complete
MRAEFENKEWDKVHQPCPLCDSSDAVGINKDRSAKCFSCDKFMPNYDDASQGKDMSSVTPIATAVKREVNDIAGTYSALSDRKIKLETAKKYGVKAQHDLQGRVTKHFYPYFNGHELSATKCRIVEGKGFFLQGTYSDTGLFGQQLFKSGKYVTITEGECDAMAAYELLGSKWAVVSIKRGAGNATTDIKESLEFFDDFENVIIAFDNDKAGKEASIKVARLFKPSKARIMTLPTGCKDPNDMLRQNKHKQFTEAWWAAKTYTPAGVINVSEQRDKFHNREKKDCVPYPYEGLNKKLYGMRQGELITLTGGTGLGKSSVTRELEHWLINKTKDNVGIIALEEDWRRTIDGILSIEANARLYIDQVRDSYSKEELDKLFDILYDGQNKNRVWVHAHFGANDLDEIFSKIRFMIIGCGCKWVVVDHLHMLVSASAEGDERRTIDSIMTRLRSIVEETGAGVILVSHLRRIDGNKGHENGIEVNLSHLRGSQSIAQLSDCVLALERNQQSDDHQESQTTKVRVLKSRYTGDVGLACNLLYDSETGRLKEISNEDLEVVDNKEGF